MKSKNTLIALLVLLAGLAYVYFVEIKGKDAKTAKEEAAKKVLDVSEDKIVGLTLTSPKGKIALEKADGKWRITEPIKTEADAFTPADLARSLVQLKKSTTVAETPKDVKDYGLDPAEVTVGFRTADGKAQEIEIGKKNPLEDSFYGRLKGATQVFLVDGSSATAFRKDLFGLRNKKLLDFNEEDVTGIEIASGGTSSTIERKDKERWVMTAPYHDLARAEALKTLLSSLRYLEAMKFVSEDGAGLAGYGLAPEQIKVKIKIGPAAATQTLMIGAKVNGEDSVFVKRDELPTVAVAGSNILSDAKKGPDDLRENRAFPFDRFDMKLLEVSSKGAGLRLSKAEGSDWKVAPVEGDKPGKEEPAAWRGVDDFCKELSELTAAEFLGAPPAGVTFDPPAFKVTYQSGADKEPTVVLIATAADACYVKDPSRPSILKLPADAAAKLKKDPAAFVEKPAAAPTTAPTTGAPTSAPPIPTATP